MATTTRTFTPAQMADMVEVLADLVGDHCPSHGELKATCSVCCAVQLLDSSVPDEHEPEPAAADGTSAQMSYKDALDFAIFAVNTCMHPDASDARDVIALEVHSEEIIATLADIRTTMQEVWT